MLVSDATAVADAAKSFYLDKAKSAYREQHWSKNHKSGVQQPICDFFQNFVAKIESYAANQDNAGTSKIGSCALEDHPEGCLRLVAVHKRVLIIQLHDLKVFLEQLLQHLRINI